jgi:hypothetical protein
LSLSHRRERVFEKSRLGPTPIPFDPAARKGLIEHGRQHADLKRHIKAWEEMKRTRAGIFEPENERQGALIGHYSRLRSINELGLGKTIDGVRTLRFSYPG